MIEDIFKNEPQFGVIAMCMACKHKWIGLVMAKTSLFKLECPACKEQDSFASFIPPEYAAEASK